MKTNAKWYRLLSEPLRMHAMNSDQREDMPGRLTNRCRG